jgi:hypothetical protein
LHDHSSMVEAILAENDVSLARLHEPDL